jgi:hypothetical protein
VTIIGSLKTGASAVAGVAVTIVVAALLAGVLVGLNQLPGVWYRWKLTGECMESQPPSETVVEWWQHRRTCETVAESRFRAERHEPLGRDPGFRQAGPQK